MFPYPARKPPNITVRKQRVDCPICGLETPIEIQLKCIPLAEKRQQARTNTKHHKKIGDRILQNYSGFVYSCILHIKR